MRTKNERVRGRRDAVVDGKWWRFEMRSSGVVVRRFRGRRTRQKVVTFQDLVHVAAGQGLLKL